MRNCDTNSLPTAQRTPASKFKLAGHESAVVGVGWVPVGSGRCGRLRLLPRRVRFFSRRSHTLEHFNSNSDTSTTVGPTRRPPPDSQARQHRKGAKEKAHNSQHQGLMDRRVASSRFQPGVTPNSRTSPHQPHVFARSHLIETAHIGQGASLAMVEGSCQTPVGTESLGKQSG